MRVALALGLIAAGVVLLLRDRPEIEREVRLRAERNAVVAQLDGVTRQLDKAAADLPAERERLVQTEKVLGELRQLQSTWEWAVGNREQQRANDERIKNLESRHAATAARVAAQERSQAWTRAERDELASARDQIEANLRLEETRKAAGAAYQLRRSWLRIRGWLLVWTGVALVGWAMVAAVRKPSPGRREAPVV